MNLKDKNIEKSCRLALKAARHIFSSKTAHCVSKERMKEFCQGMLDRDQEEEVEFSFMFCRRCRTLLYLVQLELGQLSHQYARLLYRKLEKESKEKLSQDTLKLISKCLETIDRNYPLKTKGKSKKN